MTRAAAFLISLLLVAAGPAWAALDVLGHTSVADGEVLPSVGFDQAPDAVAIGDFDGDGYDDLAVGYDERTLTATTFEGAVLLFYGSATGIGNHTMADADATLGGDQFGGRFGNQLAALDVNGDGYDDLAVNASGYDDVFVDEGTVFVFHGSASGIATQTSATADHSLRGGVASAGLSIGAAGDVNGDGREDLRVRVNDIGGTGHRAELVFHGSATGLTGTAPGDADTTYSGTATDGEPSGVIAAGDIDGDSYDDLLAGTVVLYGSATGVPDATTATVTPEIVTSFSASSSSACDTDGDGYSDVIILHLDFLNNTPALLFRGGPAGLGPVTPGDADAVWPGAQELVHLPFPLCSGDLNGDGRVDVVLHRDSAAALAAEETTLLYLGRSAGQLGGLFEDADGTVSWPTPIYDADHVPNGSVHGDVNGDGIDDLAVRYGSRVRVYHGAVTAPPVPSLGAAARLLFLVILAGLGGATLVGRRPRARTSSRRFPGSDN